MASNKKLGFFWGEKAFYVAETDNNLPIRSITIPLVANDDISLIASIQKMLRDEQITQAQVKLSIPSADVIIRSFSIPWMNPNEASSVIEFEVKKYIPFNLKDLAFAYHSVPTTEDKVKQLRVTFLAIRRELIDRYVSVLDQAGLAVVFAEPAPFSLVRSLLTKKLIPQDQRIALMQVELTVARILFVHDGLVLFIREFQLNTQMTDGAPDPQMVRDRFVNEVHNAFDFYSRSYSKQPITQMAVVSSASENPYAQWLKDGLSDITIKSIDPSVIVGDQRLGEEISMMNAFGVSLANEGPKKAIFNLYKKETKALPVAEQGALWDISLYMEAIKTTAICAVVLVAVAALVLSQVSGLKSSTEAIASKQGEFAETTIEDIMAKTKTNKEKFVGYKEIVFKSDITKPIFYLSSLLDKGMWLNSFNMLRSPSGVDINFSGSAYTEDPNQEIRLVNDYINRLKKHKRLSKYFNSFNLTTIKREEVGGRILVSFSITCTGSK